MIAVSSLHKAMHEMVAKKGDFTLFALLRRDEPLYGLWDLVVAARWLKGGTLAATREVADHLAKSIGTKGLKQLARIVVITEDNPTVKFFLKNVPVDDGERPDSAHRFVRYANRGGHRLPCQAAGTCKTGPQSGACHARSGATQRA